MALVSERRAFVRKKCRISVGVLLQNASSMAVVIRMRSCFNVMYFNACLKGAHG